MQDQFDELIKYWFPNDKYQKFWFDQSQDAEIYKKFNELLKTCQNKSYNISNMLFMELFEHIVLFDQITRNIARVENTNHRINDEIALNMAKEMIKHNIDLKFPIHQRIFILFPFRHARKTEYLDIVVDRIKLYKETSKILDMFYLATLKDYTNMTDKIIVYDNTISCHPQYSESIHDAICLSMGFPTKDKLKLNCELFKTVQKFMSNNNIKKIGLSLSGGVDSNVLMYILYQLRLAKKIDTIVAIHINYKNRPESEMERNYLIEVCQYFNIPIIVRNVCHMTRDSCPDRTVYENETKKIRFVTYQYAIEKYGLSGICLGHHKDDIAENVFMNLMKCTTLFDLLGMSEKSDFMNVNIFRPMLSHRKKIIYDFSYRHDIMYFHDSTPDWSARGKMRRKVFPMLDDLLGADDMIMGKLFSIGKESNELRGTFYRLMNDDLNITKRSAGYIVNFSNKMEHTTAYWSKILINVFHKDWITMITHKNLEVFVEWIKTSIKKYNECLEKNIYPEMTKCVLSNSYNAYLDGNDMLYLISLDDLENFSQINKEIIIDSDDIKLDTEKWNICITKTNHQQTKKIQISDLINGMIYYTEPLPPSNKLTLCGKLHPNDTTRKLFSRVNAFDNYMPKITSGHENFEPIDYVSISMKLKTWNHCP